MAAKITITNPSAKNERQTLNWQINKVNKESDKKDKQRMTFFFKSKIAKGTLNTFFIFLRIEIFGSGDSIKGFI